MATVPADDSDVGKGPREPVVRLLVLAVLLAALGLSLAALGAFDMVLIRVVTQPGLSVPLAVLLLILYGLLGNGLGLSKLYLSTNGWTRFLAGLSSSLFVSQLLLVSYLRDPSTRVNNQDFGRILEVYQILGIGDLLKLPERDPADELNQIKLGESGIGKPSEVLWRMSAFLWIGEVPLLTLLLVPGLPIRLFEGEVIEREVFPLLRNHPRFWRLSCWVLGLGTGSIGVHALLLAPLYLAVPFQGHLLAQGGAITINSEAQLRVTTFATILAMTATVFVGFAFLRVRSRGGIPAPVAINAMLCTLVTLYQLFGGVDYVIDIYGINFNKYFLRTIVVIAALGWIALANSNPWKLTFPGLESYYPRGWWGRWRGKETARLRRLNDPDTWNGLPPAPGGVEVLEQWSRHAAEVRGEGDARKPKLAVVVVSGGALRSAVWTALMIERLEKVLGRHFARHVRLVTGASGGMLGAAAYVASRFNPELFVSRDPAIGTGEEGRLSPMVKALRRPRSLDAVAQQLALFDAPSVIDPRSKDEDRGRALEATWPYLQGISFGAIRADEYAGKLPSLVFTPMFVEDGRRLLISNLDLGFACEDTLTPPVGGGPGRLLSRPAVEFRRIFHERFPQFLVSTAVRMSATFPYVTPAVCLPTDPPRSVVDAGYYDNFGVNLACQWIDHPPHRAWLEENTSGVVLIQIRDHLGCKVLTEFLGARGIFKGLRRSWAFLLDPLAGYMMSRYATSAFRNDGQVIALDRHFNRGGGPRGPEFFKTVLFEFDNLGDVALNWQLTEQDIKELQRASERDEITQELEDLRSWWGKDHAP